MSSRSYSLHHSHQILRNANNYYRKNWSKLSPAQVTSLERLLADLDQAILARKRTTADRLARELEAFGRENFVRSFPKYLFEIVIAICLALAIATVIRQMWFEPYKIPTGSMRPTFRELDHLTVSKTAFGINTPLSTSHLYFDPTLMRRAGVVIFSADGLDMQDTDTRYFWLFPAKKRLIKRCMGLPGDTFYFYGGKIYGIDKEGKDITPELNPPWMTKIPHVPFLQFEGKVTAETLDESGRVQQIYLKQMNIPVGRLSVTSKGLSGSIFNGSDWISDDPSAANKPHTTVKTYTDVLGMGNYATARLLTPEQVKTSADPQYVMEDDHPLYLELRHHPNLTYPEPRIQRGIEGQLRLYLPAEVSLIPLDEKHMKALMDAMYTIRFVVKNGRASAYNLERGTTFTHSSPHFSDVPDGTYEFYYGKAYSVSWGGIDTLLPEDHPLNQFTASNLQRLFNTGIDMHTAVEPVSREQINFPSRFAYFRNGGLYVMGGLLMPHDDATLADFVSREERREQASTNGRPYIAFKDMGAPYKDGVIDAEFLRTFGMQVPEKHYLCLGDNYARSGDSREFGFVPEDNIQGAPTWIFWPPGPRWGPPLQTSYPLLTLPRLIVWAIVALIGLAWLLYTEWRIRQPVYKKLT